ncbi:hypothetical protein ORI20_11660 [Mycobacterium sp. CVI_P3]|uniref:Lipoprotein LpqN n=1 Tax=Mycobacterium pinniadriaticum TaxID=2994102 RepID=A0ABT3SDA8_9MYCO|nr:hypothetical protein [Mycobacterium pinniadriaticum]MCX2930938.1 hypothetical protein [Mycobacterium pinniadriaticum]MCX2937362.1 hypothetical protein [Mycobacterium pinniadriaticum]
MEIVSTRAIVRVTAAAVALGLVVAGCGKDDSSSSSSETSTTTSTTTTTSAAETASAEATADEATPDYASLLITAADLPPIGTSPWTGDEPKVTMTPPPPDVTQTFTSGTNAINVSVIIADDPSQAATALTGAANSVPSQVTGTPTPLPGITPDAQATIGTSPDGKSAMAALLFTVDRTVVVMVFGSGPDDLSPVPQDYIETVGKAQVAAIESALPDLE